MRRHTRRTRLLPLLVVAILLAVGGCGTESVDAEPSIGQVERNATVTAANLAIVTDGHGRGVLVGTLINNASAGDRLLDVDAEGELEFPIAVALVDGPVLLPPENPVRLADEPAVVISADRLVQGFRAPLELTFASSAAITTTVPVEPPTGPYADIEIPSLAGSSP